MTNLPDNDTTFRSKTGPRGGGAGDRVHYLVVVEGAKPGERILLGPDPVVIGRRAPADWLLADPQVSRSHCRVLLALNEVIVIDLKSTNGTYIDGKPVFGGTPLPPGSRLEIGQHVLEHEWCTRKEAE